MACNPHLSVCLIEGEYNDRNVLPYGYNIGLWGPPKSYFPSQILDVLDKI